MGLSGPKTLQAEGKLARDLLGSHVILWEQGHLQHFGTTDYSFVAGRGHHLAGNAVHLVEGVWPQAPLVCSADEHLQCQWLLAVA